MAPDAIDAPKTTQKSHYKLNATPPAREEDRLHRCRVSACNQYGQNAFRRSKPRNQARALYQPSGAPLGDVRRAVEILEDVSAISNRVLGPDHPGTQKIQKHLDAARGKLTHAE